MYRKIFAFLSALSLALYAGSAAAAEPRVTGVDFYPSGARFVFQLEVDREGDFEFTLPGTFMVDTVRTLERGAASMRAEAIQVRPAALPELEALESVVVERRREVRLAEGRINATNHALRMIHETITVEVGGRELMGHIDRVVDRASEKRLQYELSLVDLEIEKENALRKYREALEDLHILQSEMERNMPDRSQIVRVRGTAYGTEPILFEARTNDARWSARYDINLNSETGEVSAVMFAVVAQRTGLNVEGDFSFHSRAPSLAVTAPILHPLTVRLGGGRTMMDSNVIRFGSPVNEMEAFAPAAVPEMRMRQMREITSTLANVSIRGSGRIQGDGISTSVELGRFEFPSTPLLIAIPEQNREAWIVARLDVIPDAFLPGPAALYIDGVTSGRTNIPEMGLQETLPFGMAQRVTAEKRRSVGVTGTTWLGRTGTLQNGFTIEVTNNMDTAREVEVRDRLPMPADDRITLENVRIDPAPELRDDENRLTWRMTLQPGETARIAVEYTLRYPGDETLVYW